MQHFPGGVDPDVARQRLRGIASGDKSPKGESRGGAHDDLVLALAIGVWWGLAWVCLCGIIQGAEGGHVYSDASADNT
jgi:hypothetical protein